MTKDFNQLQKTCLEEILSVGIKPAKNISFKINKRAKTRWGICKKSSIDGYTIEIAARLLEDDRISEKSCKETIIHEILHTCKGCMKHTGKWKEYAEKMNVSYGYNIKRVTSGEEKGVENHQPKEQPVKYIYICKYCGQVIQKKRACKFTKYYNLYGCGICGSRRAFKKWDI